MTQSKSNSPIHFIVGLFVLIVGFSSFMFAVRPYVVTPEHAHAPSVLSVESPSQIADGML